MKIKVFNKDTLEIETIDIEKFNWDKHLHRNSRRKFNQEELKAFWYKEAKPKPIAPKSKETNKS